MFKHTGVVMVFRPRVLQRKKLPKPLVAVFVLAQLLSGINFGFFAAVPSKRWRTLANIFSALNSLLIVVSFVYHFIYWDLITPAFVVEYFFLLITRCFSKYTIFNFLTDSMAIDDKFNIKLNSRFDLTISFCVFFACCHRLFMTYTSCVRKECIQNGTIFLITFVIYTMRHISSIILATTQVRVYYVIYLRVKYMKSAFGQGQLETKQAAKLLKDLSDCFEKINVSQNTLILVGFVTNFMKCVGYFWLALRLLKQTPILPVIMYLFVDITVLFLLICLPPLVAEMISAQMDEIKLLIHDRLHRGSNGFDDEDLLRLLGYVEARPLVRAAWRLVPVDLRLPVLLLSMSATYIIVLVQITHLY